MERYILVLITKYGLAQVKMRDVDSADRQGRSFADDFTHIDGDYTIVDTVQGEDESSVRVVGSDGRAEWKKRRALDGTETIITGYDTYRQPDSK